MRPLSDHELLQIWEQGRKQTPIHRALLLLEIAYPELDFHELCKISIGQRDVILMQLRELVFGPYLTGLENCPACGEPVEININLDEIIRSTPSYFKADSIDYKSSELKIQSDGYEVQFRLPNSSDLIALSLDNNEMASQGELLHLCLLSVRRNDEKIDAEHLPPNLYDKIEKKMVSEDPLVDIQLAAKCPSCEHGWQVTFDIISFFWSELETMAHRLMQEVYALASTFGWSEKDILAMGAWRRQYYLSMVGTSLQ